MDWTQTLPLEQNHSLYIGALLPEINARNDNLAGSRPENRLCHAQRIALRTAMSCFNHTTTSF